MTCPGKSGARRQTLPSPFARNRPKTATPRIAEKTTFFVAKHFLEQLPAMSGVDNSGGLRNRFSRENRSGRKNDDDDDDSSRSSSIDGNGNEKNAWAESERPAASPGLGATVCLLSILRTVAVVLFVAGTLLRTSLLHTGEECSMTYSMRVFLPVETAFSPSSPASEHYGLFRFVDRRDPYYHDLVRKQNRRRLNGGPPILGRGDHCGSGGNTTTGGARNHVVVYVPGHWGTYDQARSLGAHGIGLTGATDPFPVVEAAKQRIRAAAGGGATGENDGEDDHAKAFVYHVYALDFGEQGGALHGGLLDSQSEFLAGVLAQLSDDCGLRSAEGPPRAASTTASTATSTVTSSLTVVAHSMGGIVARRVLVEQQQQQKQKQKQLQKGYDSGDGSDFRVHQMITLATPHSNPLYAFDKSVADYYQKWLRFPPRHGESENENDNDNERAPLMVSIVGGLRDEMIEPAACYLDGPNSETILATNLLSSGPRPSDANQETTTAATPRKGLGMDHRAIVWCHQLLEEVREILWSLIDTGGTGSRDRLHGSLERFSGGSNNDQQSSVRFARDLEELNQDLVELFGSLASVCMQASMLYNLPYLLALYAVLVVLSCAVAAFPSGSVVFGTPALPPTELLPLGGTVVLGWVFRGGDLLGSTTLILALVADSVRLLLVHLLGKLCGRDHKPRSRNPFRTLGRALLSTVLAVSFLSTGAFCGVQRFGSEGLTEFLALWAPRDLVAFVVYCCVATSICTLSLAGMGCACDDRGGAFAFEAHLVALVVLVVPFLAAGPLALAAWERGTRPSSWWTLLSLQVPVGARALLRAASSAARAGNGKPRDRGARTTGSPGGRPRANPGTPRDFRNRKLSLARSAALVLAACWMCCREPGLLSRGTGYLVPQMAEVLVWVDAVYVVAAAGNAS